MGEKSSKEGTTANRRQRWWLVLCAVAGVALMLIGNKDWSFLHGSDKTADVEEQDPLTAYTALIEQRIASLCESVCGVDQVTVVVTLEGDFTYIYATDSESSERDGVIEQHTAYVTVGSGANETTVLLTRQYPRVSGIGIVCRGGGDATVRRELLSLLSAAYGVPTNQIYIAEAKG
jgi:stage III sporulation protein AG